MSASRYTYATIKGFEVMRALRKGQAGAFTVISRATAAARRASSSAPSVSEPALSPRPSGSSASGSHPKQPDGTAHSSSVRRAPLPVDCNRAIEAFAASTELSVREIQKEIDGRASRSVVGEITKRVRATAPPAL